jgi:hypothetical protein
MAAPDMVSLWLQSRALFLVRYIGLSPWDAQTQFTTVLSL